MSLPQYGDESAFFVFLFLFLFLFWGMWDFFQSHFQGGQDWKGSYMPLLQLQISGGGYRGWRGRSGGGIGKMFLSHRTNCLLTLQTAHASYYLLIVSPTYYLRRKKKIKKVTSLMVNDKHMHVTTSMSGHQADSGKESSRCHR